MTTNDLTEGRAWLERMRAWWAPCVPESPAGQTLQWLERLLVEVERLEQQRADLIAQLRTEADAAETKSQNLVVDPFHRLLAEKQARALRWTADALEQGKPPEGWTSLAEDSATAHDIIETPCVAEDCDEPAEDGSQYCYGHAYLDEGADCEEEP